MGFRVQGVESIIQCESIKNLPKYLVFGATVSGKRICGIGFTSKYIHPKLRIIGRRTQKRQALNPE